MLTSIAVRWSAALCGVAGLTSLAVTFVVVDAARGIHPPTITSISEPLVLLGLIFVAARWAQRLAWPAVSVAIAALGLMVLRHLGTQQLDASSVFAVAVWSGAAVAVAFLGWGLRVLARARDVAARAREAQNQLAIARDLHDFVGHDLSELVAYAQAASYVADDPLELRRLLGRIEAAGRSSLESMDETVRALHGEVRGVAALPELVDRFNAAQGPRATLTMPADYGASLTPAVSALAYRTITECLTNVRKHAPSATVVAVSVRVRDPEVVVDVADDGQPDPSHLTAPGRGLSGLRERAAGLGGSLTHQAVADRWQVRLILPTGAGGTP